MQEKKIRERIEKNLEKIEDEKTKEIIRQELLMDDFEDILYKINYKHEDKVEELVQKAKNIKALQGWPENKQKFWDMEATNWKLRIPTSIKEFISAQLNKETGQKNLDIGSGSTNYTKNFASTDISYEMLDWNNNKNKTQATAEKLPFKKNTFNTTTLVFTANYVSDTDKLAKELYRILKKKGKAIIVQSAKPVHKLHKLAENKEFSTEKLTNSLKKAGFKTKQEEKTTGNTKLLFIEAKK